MINKIKKEQEQGAARLAATSSHITKRNESSLVDRYFVSEFTMAMACICCTKLNRSISMKTTRSRIHIQSDKVTD